MSMRIPIERYTLDNGLRVVLSRDPAIPVVAVNLWYDAGSRNDRPGRTGLAHLFEHMMFQGSTHVEGTAHITEVERVGGSVNGSTWLDRTNYYCTVPANRLELALWLESDRMGFFLPALTDEKLENQRAVVKNERRQRVDNQPYGDWDERIQRMLFPPDHPYHHSVIGSMDDLDAATMDDVRDFFRTYYAPDNAVLTLCGDFDAAEARALVDRYFGPIPRGPGAPPLPGSAVLDPLPLPAPLRDEVEAAVALPRVYLAWRVPPYGTEAFYAGDLLCELLSGGKSARLYRHLVRERRIARAVSAFAFPVVTGAALLVVRGNLPAGGDPEALEAALLAEIAALGAEGPAEGEMARALTGLETRHVLELQRVSERADQLSMLTTYFDDPERINSELDRYRAVSPEDVRRFVADYLRPEQRGALVYRPLAAEAAA
jgi:zinc protease